MLRGSEIAVACVSTVLPLIVTRQRDTRLLPDFHICVADQQIRRPLLVYSDFQITTLNAVCTVCCATILQTESYDQLTCAFYRH